MIFARHKNKVASSAGVAERGVELPGLRRQGGIIHWKKSRGTAALAVGKRQRGKLLTRLLVLAEHARLAFAHRQVEHAAERNRARIFWG